MSTRGSTVKRAMKRKIFNEGSKRGKYLCFFCQRPLTFAQCTLEHLKPLSQDGRWDRRNLELTCKKCNTARGTIDWRVFKASVNKTQGVESGDEW